MPRLKSWLKTLPVIRSLEKINRNYYSMMALEKKNSDLLDAINRLQTEKYNHYSLSETKPGVNCGTNKNYDALRKNKIVVSLTTYGHRINSVNIAIESLMQQSLKADRIILWITEGEFTDADIPRIVNQQKDRGLEVRTCQEMRSYKKIIPALQEYPDDLIITADDDFIYPINHIERLYCAHLKNPNQIHCVRAHRMTYDHNGFIKPYSSWEKKINTSENSMNIFPNSGAGTLYFPGCFDEDVTNLTNIKNLCPNADDIWLKYMSFLKGVKSNRIPLGPLDENLLIIPGTQTKTLWSINKYENDQQLSKLISYFKKPFKSDPSTIL